MKHVTAREANQHFAKVLSAVEGGEQVVISKRGKPVAVMSPYKPALDAEHAAAVERLKAVLDEPVILPEGFRTYSRDEMHERP
jgi:prevent-host-death family protein